MSPSVPILYRGRPHRVQVRLLGLSRSTVVVAGGVLWVLVAPSERLTPRAVLVRWLKGQARGIIVPRAEALARGFGLGYRRIFIRSQRTRWGTCSRAGNLSFNFRLILTPPEVLDYVIVHELAHLRVLDHSRRFWALVASMQPDFRRHRLWLARHGALLMRVV